MKYFKISMFFLLFFFISSTIVKSQVTLTIWPIGRSYKRAYNISFNGQEKYYSFKDSILVQLPTQCKGKIDFIIKETPMNDLAVKKKEVELMPIDRKRVV